MSACLYGTILFVAAASACAAATGSHDSYPARPIRIVVPFVPASGTANVMVVNPSLDVLTVEQLLEVARTDPGTLRYASGGIGTAGHLAGELLKTMTRANLTHVPYKGSPAAMAGILAGEAQISFTSLVSTLPHVKSGKLRAVAVTSLKRAQVLPAVPTLHESGVTGFEVSGWQGVFAPAGTPDSIRQKLQREIARAIHVPELSKHMAVQGLTTVGSTPQEFRRYVVAEVTKWSELIGHLGLGAESR